MNSLVVAGAAIDRSIVFRLAMAIYAITHREALVLLHFFHFLNWAMALLALFAGLDVSRVIELHMIWQEIDLLPFNRCFVGVSLNNFRNVWAVFAVHLANDQVAVHTNINGRHRRMPRNFRCRVTVFAIETQLASMERMGVRNGLRGFVIDIVPDHDFIVGQSVNEYAKTKSNSEAEHCTDDFLCCHFFNLVVKPLSCQTKSYPNFLIR